MYKRQITYTLDKDHGMTYYYQLTEEKGNTANITYSQEQYLIKAVVSAKDVYKRQVICWATRCSKRFRMYLQRCSGRVMSVSYTHLDVYKRQAYMRSQVLSAQLWFQTES